MANEEELFVTVLLTEVILLANDELLVFTVDVKDVRIPANEDELLVTVLLVPVILAASDELLFATLEVREFT
jgi:hypothetical protein